MMPNSTKSYNAINTDYSDCSLDQIPAKTIPNFHDRNPNYSSEELVLKVRVANVQDLDFIEIDLPRSNLTYQALLQVCCQELNIDENRVMKLRKLPDTKIRRDKDVERLRNFQEIEVVTESSLNSQSSNGIAVSLTASNNYQSISKKDQTILY